MESTLKMTDLWELWRTRICPALLCALVAATIGLAMGSDARSAEETTPSNVSPDEEVYLFPTSAALTEDQTAWKVPIHGWIFEPETDDPLRRVVIGRLVKALDGSVEAPDEEGLAICEKRILQFIVDNERSKRMVIRVGEETFALEPSTRDGHFTGEITVAAEKAAGLAMNGWLPIEVVMPASDERKFQGTAQLIADDGVLVISDIDDTVKVTEVTQKGKLIENTFFREFKAVDGMAAVYRRWQDQGTAFAFVSGSPWQLYRPLLQFFAKEEFPLASFHLKEFSLKDPSVAGALADPDGHKLQAIAEILTRHSKRRIVLIGDSGERDPEIYGKVARENRERIERIFIRRVTDDKAISLRYRRAFEMIPHSKWKLFDNSTELPQQLD